MQKIALVSTVLNQANGLKETLDSIDKQYLLPDEFVIVDGGSKDGTYERLMNWSKERAWVRVLNMEGLNVAGGRNFAIRETKSEIIVSTDFGCIHDRSWLQALVKPLLITDAEVVGGNFAEYKVKRPTRARKSDWLLQYGYQAKMDEYFSVSSRSIAYYKYVWDQVGGYPEWLTLAADDTIFWKLIKKYGFRYVFVERPLVYWMRHNTNRGFAKEAGRYGLGDGESRINFRNFLSNLLETGLRYLFLSSLLGFPFLINEYPLYPVLLFLTLPGLRSYYRATKNWIRMRSPVYNLPVLLNAFLQIEMSRFSYLKGYIKGILDPDTKKAEGRRQLWSVLK